MKKSELRKIIRESIKQLINEQGNDPTGCYNFIADACPSNPAPQKQSDNNKCATINGQVPQVGMHLDSQGLFYTIIETTPITSNYTVNYNPATQGECGPVEPPLSPSPPPVTSCDNSPSGSCAQKWFGWRANKMAIFINANGNGRNCTGPYTYEGPSSRFENKYNNRKSWFTNKILNNGYANHTVANLFSTLEGASNYDSVKNAVENIRAAAGVNKRKADKLIRVTVKHNWAKCMIDECGC
tara:strand:- start:68 stop:790 length:723 start_codon:yes stop_codon:yes gene_type:complete